MSEWHSKSDLMLRNQFIAGYDSGIENEKTAPPPTNFQVEAQCYPDVVDIKIGLKISWEIRAKYLSDSVDCFKITIVEVHGGSGVTATAKKVTQKNVFISGPIVFFEYFYAGYGEEVVIHKDGRYDVEILSIPKYNPADRQQIISRDLLITENFMRQNQECQARTTTINQTMTDSSTSSTNVLIVLVIGVAVVLVFAAVIAVRVRRKPGLSRERVLILLNTSNLNGNDNINKMANHMATAMRRARRMGPPEVKHNRWESNKIAEIGIMQWMKESIEWTDKIIIISIPDSSRNENDDSERFENAFRSAIDEHALRGENLARAIFVVHFSDIKDHRNSPYINNTNYMRFHLDEDWEKLCRNIARSESAEQQPLNMA